MKTTTIEIDFDIHKLIEAERRSFSEKPLFALRRLLDLPELDEDKDDEEEENFEIGRSWYREKVDIPHGSKARMKYDYGRQVYEGRFLDGKIVVGDQRFASLSAAASALAVTKYGSKTRLNGWVYWEVQKPGSSKWEKLL